MNIPYTRKIGDTFYFRIAVPSNLRATFKSKEILKSLQTRNKREARALATAFAAKYQEQFRNMSNAPKDHLSAAIQAQTEMINNLQKQVTVLQQALLSQMVPPSMAPVEQTNCIKLTEAFEEFVDEKTHNKKWKKPERMEKRYRREIDKFIELNGDVMLHEISQSMLRQFQKYLRTHLSKYKKNLHGSYAAYARRIKKSEYILPEQQKAKYQILLSFLKWIKDNYPRDFSTHLNLKPIEIYVDSNRRGKRRAFSQEELVWVLQHETWTRPKFSNDMHFWIPLIGLYTGMRTGEICQLYRQDIVTVDNFEAFRIAEEFKGQSIKNKNSFRMIPVHPELENLGFLDFLNKSHNQLFPLLWKNGKCNPSTFQQRFSNTVLKGRVPRCGELSFYSLRHFVQNHAQKCNMDGDKVDMMFGHLNHLGNRSVVSRDYGMTDKVRAWADQYIQKYTCDEIIKEAGVKRWAASRRLSHGLKKYKSR